MMRLNVLCSAAAAPHFNALQRLFPQLRMFAIDSASNHIINAQVHTLYGRVTSLFFSGPKIGEKKAGLWIRIGFNGDPDPSFYLSADPNILIAGNTKKQVPTKVVRRP
jgi:hypothetical protein